MRNDNKSDRLRIPFAKKIDNLIFEYIDKGLLEADIIRELETAKIYPLSKILANNVKELGDSR